MTKGDSRSSLASHAYPPFYACYLLKSLSSPRSRTTYIGSTPNPLRRIRQHNGELTQGAWKTRQHRPWVMVMIVYGFPSKLHALQFEWAWQHPEVSRHMREEFKVKRNAYYLGEKVKVLRAMLAHAPYRTWPLHVKLFHEDGLKAWRASEIYFQGEPPLPTMCRIELELEGVDGKAGGGTGRAGGIEVNDEAFAGAHVRKLRRILGTSKLHTCSICEQALLPSLPALTTALCPLGSCSATSHISCLAGDFLKQKPTDTMMPRTGTCKLCGHTLLWGDIVRGCYRRQKGGLPTTAEDNEEQEEDEDEDDEDEDGLDVQEGPLALAKSIIQSPARSLPTRKGPPAFSVSKPGLSAMHASKPRGSKNEHNRHIPSPKNAREMYLDIDDISSLSASESAPKTARVSAKRRASLHKVSTANGRRRLSIPPRSLSLSKPQASIAAKTRPNRPKPAPKRPATQVSHASGEEFDLDNISSCSDD